jgi:hypothetical protein
MATTITKQRGIKYLNRDFNSFKADLVTYLQTYFPTSYQDFNASSAGMMMTELIAFIGDNLSYYVDKKFDESFIETAKEVKNVYKHARQLGYKVFGKTSAIGAIDAFLKVPATSSAGQIIPDMRYAGIIQAGAQLKNSKNGNTYETLTNIDFSTILFTSSLYVQVGDTDPRTSQPTTFVLKQSYADPNRITNVMVKAGQTKTISVPVGAYQPFTQITLPDQDVIEILSMFDSEGNQYYETDFLAQDTIFDGVPNAGNDATEVPYVLTLRSVPYRFVTDFNPDTRQITITFGTGDALNFDGDLIPDLGDLSLPLYGRNTFTDFSIDPQNFLVTRTLGIAPVNTTLTITYRVGGGLDTNAGQGDVDTVANSVFSVANSALPANTVRDVANSFSVSNPQPIQGGKDELSLDEIKALISAFFAAQSRCVTIEDFIVRSLSMPSKFGSVFRATAKINPLNANSIELILLSQDQNGYCTVCPPTLKTNLQTYLSRFRMLTDAIEEMDAQIINLSLNVNILCNPDFVKSTVIANCISSLQEFFVINRWQLNQPINMSNIHSTLMQVPGVLAVVNINFVNMVGNVDNRAYSDASYNLSANTKNNIIYCGDNSIFEVKYPNKDITVVAQ